MVWSRRAESNSRFDLRSVLFYPLNYGERKYCMFISWTTTKEFTPLYKNEQRHELEFVPEATVQKAEFVEYPADNWPKLQVNLQPYWGSIRGTNSY